MESSIKDERTVLDPYLSLPNDSDEYTQKLYANLTEIKEKIDADETQMIFVAHRYEQTGRIPWRILSRRERFVFVLISCLRLIAFLLSLFIFIVTLDLLTSAFQLLSRSIIGRLFQSRFFLRNPIVSVMCGILITTILQSSSTVTSIIVSMVGSGIVEDIRIVVPMIMGANIGTSITNTLVAFSQLGNRHEFARSFSSGVLMDVFNYLTTLILLPLEILLDHFIPAKDLFHRGGYLSRLSGLIAQTIPQQNGTNIQLLKVITKPMTKLIIQIDDEEKENSSKIGRIYCPPGSTDKCSYLFRSTIENHGDQFVGTILLFVSLFVLTTILILMVKLLKSLIIGVIDDALKKILQIRSTGTKNFLFGYVFIVVGIFGSILVQSSSVFCSILTPLVGLEVLALERNYELTIGANIGTTITAILASLTQTGKYFRQSIQIALTHFLFNISGCLLWYVFPYGRRIPLVLSRKIGQIVSNYRWFALFYVAFVFFLFPLILLIFALIHWLVALTFLLVFIFLLVSIFLLNFLQKTRRNLLPTSIRTWKFLPRPFRSLNFWDRRFERFLRSICCQRCVQIVYPSIEHEKPLKNQYLTMKNRYLNALDHRFLSHTNQLNQIYEKHHAPIIATYESRNPITYYMHDFYYSLTGKRTLGQRTLEAFLHHQTTTNNDENEDEDLIDRIIVFDRSKNRETNKIMDAEIKTDSF